MRGLSDTGVLIERPKWAFFFVLEQNTVPALNAFSTKRLNERMPYLQGVSAC